MSTATIGIPLFNAKAADGTDLNNVSPSATGPSQAGKFKLQAMSAGGFALVGETANGCGASKTDTVVLPVVVPANFVPSTGTLSLGLSTGVMATNPGQNLTPASAISISVSRVNNDGSVTAIPVTTAAQSLPNPSVSSVSPTYSQQTFSITGTPVNPGDVLLLSVQITVAVGQSIDTKAMICAAQLTYATS